MRHATPGGVHAHEVGLGTGVALLGGQTLDVCNT